ncbi:PQQ-dependent sugar dehydrogenase [Janibacter sp. DB-40]|uniref:PQQ-dependent sugar dehydrogenase n=1 Tax=Janibacter sp. DB-40 TaxID=3028808 RepID=UPI002406A46E|nr:PQQ-dependent sugar dehydrogenase [Janibacter sp. DB-40]
MGETITSGLETPWDVDFLADGTAVVTLRDSGEVLRLDEDGDTTVLDAGGEEGAVPDVQHASEDGLLGLAVGPDDGIYLYFTTESDNRVVRYDIDGDELVNQEVILEGIPTNENHSGGRLAFGPDGYLYVTTGDTRNLDLPQDTSSLAGKILRITTSGEPAPGNPFDNEVWSYGHRNVQGLGWTSDGTMYASEFGSSMYDELNLIESGANYGWPEIEGWADDSDYTNPLVTWGTSEASPSGIAVTDEGVWMSALMGERLWYIPLGEDGSVGEPKDFDMGLGRLRTVVTTPDDDLWVVTSNTDGRGDPSDSDDRIVRLQVD